MEKEYYKTYLVKLGIPTPCDSGYGFCYEEETTKFNTYYEALNFIDQANKEIDQAIKYGYEPNCIYGLFEEQGFYQDKEPYKVVTYKARFENIYKEN